MNRIIIFCIVCVITLDVGIAQDIGAGTKYNGIFIGAIDTNGKNTFSRRSKPSDARVVSNAKELLSAINAAKSGTVIYVKDNSVIDLSLYKNINVPEGLTIMGNRGVNNSKGPLIFTRSHGVHPLFEVTGDNVTFSGLRIRGADGEKLFKNRSAFSGKSKKQQKDQYLELYNKNMYATSVSTAIATRYNNLLIENCELYQWTHTAVELKKGAKNAVVRYNYIHHNQRFGLGYGVKIDQAEANIIANLFNYNRHSIASTGRSGSIYVAHYNIFKEGGNETWAVDMHGSKDWSVKGNLAGEYLEVKNNTFYLKGAARAVVVRGVPSKESLIADNEIIFLDDQKGNPIQQTNAKGNLKEIRNLIKKTK